MQHRRKGRILQREKGPRKALLDSLMRALILKNGIFTTEARGKEMRPRLERLITQEKAGTLAAHRRLVATVGPDAAAKMKRDILPQMINRTGGYIRIEKVGVRKSDASRMVRVSFVE